jgi:cobyrinic acid a,c-diamide synthase
MDVGAALALAQAAPALPRPSKAAPSLFAPQRPVGCVRIAIALDDAFHFYYEDGLDLLRAHGAELLAFSPLRDRALPPGTQGIYLGGGFPEVFAEELAANDRLLAAVRAAALDGVPVYAECGGLMYLGAGIVDAAGRRHRMARVFSYWSHLRQPRVTMGYRVATAARPTLLLQRGQTVRGHEFHWSTLDTPPPAAHAAYTLTSADGRPVGSEGVIGGPADNVLASYVHLHFAANPALAPALVAACGGGRPRRYRARRDAAD